MIDDLLIINESGALIFNWHPDANIDQGKDDLLSGFLTALNSFASVERGEDIKILKLKETTIIFERFEEYNQKLTFVVTTKNDELIELLHLFIHEVMDHFTAKFKKHLEHEFDGGISIYRDFNEKLSEIIDSLGLDILEDSIQNIDTSEILKSIVYLEPENGKILYIQARHYLNKDKIIYLIPLLLNSTRLLYNLNLNEEIIYFQFNTVQNDILVVEIRNKILIVKQYQLKESVEGVIMNEEFIHSKEKGFKKIDKNPRLSKNFDLNPKIKQFFIVDLDGKIQYSKIIDNSYDCSEFIPETISFLISSRKASEEIYNKTLFSCTIGGKKLITICVNFNKYGLVLIGNTGDYDSFEEIQNVILSVINKL